MLAPRGLGRGLGRGAHSGMSITRSSSPSRASSPLPASLNICRGTALRIVGGGILGGGRGAKAAPTPAPEPRPGKVSGPPTGQSGGPTAICSRGRDTGRAYQGGTGSLRGLALPLKTVLRAREGGQKLMGAVDTSGQPRLQSWNLPHLSPFRASNQQVPGGEGW